GHRRGARVQAVTLRVGQVGLGYWGRNLARVFDDEADLAWLCDANEELRREFAGRYPNAQITGDFAEMITAGALDAVVIATPVPTHYPLAKAALEAGKHVFVEKPPAMRAAEMEELIGLAEARGLVKADQLLHLGGPNRRRDGGADRPRRGSRPRPHARPPPPLS